MARVKELEARAATLVRTPSSSWRQRHRNRREARVLRAAAQEIRELRQVENLLGHIPGLADQIRD